MAASGSRSAASSEPPDLAVIDIMLPALDGFVAYRGGSAAGPRRSPCLILSAQAALVDDRVQRPANGGALDDLPDEAVRLCRAPGARPGADPPRDLRAPSRPNLTRQGSRHRSPVTPCDTRRPADRSPAAGVRPARVPRPARRPGRVEDDDPVTGLGATRSTLAPTSSTCWCVGCARKNRPPLRAQASPPDATWHGVCPARR